MENIISIIASIVLIVFDARYIGNPLECYWPKSACKDSFNTFGVADIYNLSSIETAQLKKHALNAQLACAVIMLVVSLAFVGCYIYTAIKVRGRIAVISEHVAMEMNQPPPPVWSVPAPTPTPAPMWQPHGSHILPPIPHASVGGFVRN